MHALHGRDSVSEPAAMHRKDDSEHVGPFFGKTQVTAIKRLTIMVKKEQFATVVADFSNGTQRTSLVYTNMSSTKSTMDPRAKRSIRKPPRYVTSEEERNIKRISGAETDIICLKKFIAKNVSSTKDKDDANVDEEVPFTDYEYLSIEQEEEEENECESERQVVEENLIQEEQDELLLTNCTDMFRSINNRMMDMESQLTRLNNIVEKMFKYIQPQGYSQKPSVIPLSTTAELNNFDNVEEDIYANVVQYLKNIGGYNLKEVVYLCFKEAIKEETILAYTWWGRETNMIPLYDKKIMFAIYDAVCLNKHFSSPTKKEFQDVAREALRATKERLRSRQRFSQNNTRSTINRNVWQ